MSNTDAARPVILDVGSHSFRVGFAGESELQAEFPSCAGYAVDDVTMSGRKYAIGRENIKTGMEITSCLQDGMVENWELFDQLLEYMYSAQIKLASDKQPILITEASWNTDDKRERTAQLMFEKYRVPAFYTCSNALLAAYGNGLKTALILDSGATYTAAVPIFDTKVIKSAILKSPLAGDFLEDECRKMMEARNLFILPPTSGSNQVCFAESAAAKRQKLDETGITKSHYEFITKCDLQGFASTVLQITEAPFNDSSKYPSIAYDFPDGITKQDFGTERFRIPESLFIGQNIDKGVLGMCDIVTSSINMCDANIRKSLYKSITVVGGNSLLNGFTERLGQDLTTRIPADMQLKVVASPERRFSSWAGASVFASMPTFKPMWITKAEYEEVGPSIVKRKCA